MQDDSGAGFKYAALTFLSPPGPAGPNVMHGGKETLVKNIPSLVPPSEHARWREWVGSVAWGSIERADRVVLLRAQSSAPSVPLLYEEFTRGRPWRRRETTSEPVADARLLVAGELVATPRDNLLR